MLCRKRNNPKRLPSRLILDAAAASMQGLLSGTRTENVAPFEFKGSLAKLGVREKLAAEEPIDRRTVQFLSGQNGKLDHAQDRGASDRGLPR